MRDRLCDYRALVREWRALERTHGLTVTDVSGAQESTPLMLLDIDAGGPRVAISAGVHGDEPAAPWALLSLVRDGLLDNAFSYRAWLCTNPRGYERGTRANADGADVNRSFSRDALSATTPEARAIERANLGRRFLLSLDLHEDVEADGFYCYEPVVEGSAPYGRRVVCAMDDAGLPVQRIAPDFDLGYPKEATHLRVLERGRVLPDVAAEVAHFEGLPYSMYLLWTGTAKRTMTLETPCRRPWEERIAMHRVAVVNALDALKHATGEAGTHTP